MPLKGHRNPGWRWDSRPRKVTMHKALRWRCAVVSAILNVGTHRSQQPPISLEFEGFAYLFGIFPPSRRALKPIHPGVPQRPLPRSKSRTPSHFADGLTFLRWLSNPTYMAKPSTRTSLHRASRFACKQQTACIQASHPSSGVRF